MRPTAIERQESLTWLSTSALLLTTLANEPVATQPAARTPAAVRCVAVNAPPDAHCYSILVPEDRSRTNGRVIPIHFLVLRARGNGVRKEPLFLLQGGPGVESSPMAGTLRFPPAVRVNRDLVFVDQRGSGGSNALTCQEAGLHDPPVGEIVAANFLTRCREILEARAALKAYTTAESVEDLEAVRRHLGYRRIDLHGFSYGTRLAQAYMRAHPERLGRVVLDGVLPLDALITHESAQQVQEAVDAVFDACERDVACRATFPRARAELDTLFSRVERETRLRTSRGQSAASETSAQVGAWELTYAIRGTLYGPLAARLPLWVHRAVTAGDFTPFLEVYRQRIAWIGGDTGVGLHLGVYCTEDLPYTRGDAVAAASAGTLMRDHFYRQYRRMCDIWRLGHAVPPRPMLRRLPTPALLLSGGWDPVTPPSSAERVLRLLPNGRHVVFAGQGHATQSPCKWDIVLAFLNSGNARTVDVSCAGRITHPPFDLGDR